MSYCAKSNDTYNEDGKVFGGRILGVSSIAYLIYEHL